MTNESFIGSIGAFAGTFAPHNWAYCAGQVFAITSNTALFSIIGDAFGGDGRSTMGYPDLRGRVIIGEGSGPGLTARFRGQFGGLEAESLSVEQLPAHTHTAVVSSDVTTQPDFTADATLHTSANNGGHGHPNITEILAGSSTVAMYDRPPTNSQLSPESITVEVTRTANVAIEVRVDNSSTGSNRDFNIVQPFQVIGYFLCEYGIYPSRN